ncbi:MAG: ATP-binding cassette domain-containing protein [Sodalis sp. (in: enterobacteria)]|uniref:ATP-binding cassette domain-containing protein n=1 Tax=Sodalis sp. (in: enterobacteria) TaxID=1898979 RepID=UPI003F3C65F0
MASGKTLGLIGESGSGKTTLGRAVIGLTPISGGMVQVNGREPQDASDWSWRGIRCDTGLIFQDPMAALDPHMRVEKLVTEPFSVNGREIDRRAGASRLLLMIGLPAAVIDRYPHQLAGGQARRVAVARALNSVIFNDARLIGPALGGVLVDTVGEGWCFAFIAASYVPLILFLFTIRMSQRPPSTRLKGSLHEMGEGLALLRQEAPALRILLLVGLCSLTSRAVFFLSTHAGGYRVARRSCRFGHFNECYRRRRITGGVTAHLCRSDRHHGAMAAAGYGHVGAGVSPAGAVAAFLAEGHYRRAHRFCYAHPESDLQLAVAAPGAGSSARQSYVILFGDADWHRADRRHYLRRRGGGDRPAVNPDYWWRVMPGGGNGDLSLGSRGPKASGAGLALTTLATGAVPCPKRHSPSIFRYR